MLDKTQKESLFVFLEKCEIVNKSLIETLKMIQVSANVSTTEAIDLVVEYRKRKGL